jgi:DNA-binding NtrC family response regulator
MDGRGSPGRRPEKRPLNHSSPANPTLSLEPMNKRAKILVIDDDPTVLELTKLNLNYEGYEVTTAEGGEIGLKLSESQHFDLILTDLHMPDLNGSEIVKRVKARTPETEIIMISGLGTIPDAVSAIKAGAFYFIEKPIEFEQLLVLTQMALERRSQSEEIRTQAAEISQLRGRLRSPDSYFNIVGSSKAMRQTFDLIDSVAESDANVMIVGESGTGKEMVANAMHFRSLRADKPFVKINCAALPKELIESELFGHTKGAFTGAATDKTGLIGQAKGGSLLLDEIGEMPLELQPKLLRVLQERVYTRLGSEKPQEADFRLITATNRDPLDAIREGRLREDLYYRINTILVPVPPLRERSEDVQKLAEHFLRVFAVKYRRPAREFAQSAWERLLAYAWPGNVRELQNFVERAVLLSKGSIIEAESFPFEQTSASTSSASTVGFSNKPSTAPAPAPAAGGAPVAVTPPPVNEVSTHSPLQELCQSVIQLAPLPQPGTGSMTFFEQLEGPLVNAALQRTNGNKQAAADLLGIYRPRLYNILKRHNANLASNTTEPEEEALNEL